MKEQPFYIGEQVLAINAMEGSAIKNGQIYKVYSCTYEPSGNPISPPGAKYWYVGVIGHHKWLKPSIFISLHSYKTVSFAEIKELLPSEN